MSVIHGAGRCKGGGSSLLHYSAGPGASQIYIVRPARAEWSRKEVTAEFEMSPDEDRLIVSFGLCVEKIARVCKAVLPGESILNRRSIPQNKPCNGP